MKNQHRSPRIKHVSWGRLEVEGKAEPYKDAKLFPGGSREWNWRESGTEHSPGIQPADVQELLDHSACAAYGRSRGALQPARGNRAGGRTVPHDMLKTCDDCFI